MDHSTHLSVPETCQELGLSRSRVTQLIRQGVLDAERFGNIYLVLKSSLPRARERPMKPGWTKGRPRKVVQPTSPDSVVNDGPLLDT